MTDDLVVSTDSGLYCPQGDFHIDPWTAVNRAVTTHAHADHATTGSTRYLTPESGKRVLQARLGPDSLIETVKYGQGFQIGSVQVTLFPAGHILGSAQVRIECKGRVWVVSGDYKTERDATCDPFEPLPCDTFVTESTFGLPIFRWARQSIVFDEINDWWRSNAAQGRVTLIYAYSLGKAQRVLAGVDPSIGPIYCHGAIERLNEIYRMSGVRLPETRYAGEYTGRDDGNSRALVLAPPSARSTPWLRRFGDFASAFASGWMQIRGARRRRAVERGFVLSDHADWPSLLATIRETGARRILVTHGTIGPLVRWLREQGFEAGALETEFYGEQDEVTEAGEASYAAPPS